MTSGNGLSVTYTPFNKPATITRGTTSIAFDHDPEHQRFAKTSLAGITQYIAGGGVLAERFAGSGGIVRWTNFLMVGGRYIGFHVENSDGTTLTRYCHPDDLWSITAIPSETGHVEELRSYDAWGVRRSPETGQPLGSVTSQSSRGFTSHEHLEEVGLIHMNGRVYDPLLARFGTPDPMTENPFSTQGWNRYTYVGNSPVNFTDPSGYCFLGCFWKPIFNAIGNAFREVAKFIRQNFVAIVQVAATAACTAFTPLGPLCAGIVSTVSTGVTSGDWGLAFRAGITAIATAAAFDFVGTNFPNGSLGNIAGHALVGCASAVLQRGKCGPGALSAGITAFAGPMINGRDFSVGSLVANAVVGGVASIAGGGSFANGAVTAAYGYLFNWIKHTDGTISVDPIDIGNDAHAAFAKYMESLGYLANKSTDGYGAFFGGRPDGFNPDGPVGIGLLWELKPDNIAGKILAAIDVGYYVTNSWSLLSGHGYMPGDSGPIPPTVTGQFGTYELRYAGPGMVLYTA